MAGIARKVIMKASEPVSITLNIQYGLWVVQLVSSANHSQRIGFRGTNVISSEYKFLIKKVAHLQRKKAFGFLPFKKV